MSERPDWARAVVRARLRGAGALIDYGRLEDAHRIIMGMNSSAAERREFLTPAQLKRWVAYNKALRVKLHGGRVVK